MNAVTATRISAEERREVVIKAATTEFAATGYAGTSTESIARRAGVSQPYLFQLFGTKRDLFLAVVRACFGRCRGVFEHTGAAARAQNPDPCFILDAMG
ncbi:MAG TPA: helix-turn-helix domain-containing protein, partial [Gemmatimonadales bacterium]